MRELKRVEVHLYKTLADCVSEFIGQDALKCADNHYLVWPTGERRKIKKFIQNTTITSWGFAIYSEKSIHLWFSENCSQEDMIKTIAHELAHLRKPRPKNKRQEELKAAMTGRDARKAYQIMNDILSRKQE